MINFNITFTMPKIDVKAFDVGLNKIGAETVNHIKMMIQNGKNIYNQTFNPKVDGYIPDFRDSGKLLSSITYKVKNGELTIYSSDSDVQNVLYHLSNNGKNWILLSNSPYIDKYITQKVQLLIKQILK